VGASNLEAGPQEDPAPGRRPARRRNAERIWVVATVAWGLLRVLVVWHYLAHYGVNPWVYLFIEVATSAPYGVATARLVTSLIDKQMRSAYRWAMASAALFVAPDLYLVASGRSMPVYVYVTIGMLVVGLGAASVVSVVSKVRDGRRDRAAKATLEAQALRP